MCSTYLIVPLLKYVLYVYLKHTFCKGHSHTPLRTGKIPTIQNNALNEEKFKFHNGRQNCGYFEYLKFLTVAM